MAEQIYRKKENIGRRDPSIPLTVKECAEIAGISPRRIRAFIASGRLKATKAGKQWLVKLWDLADFDSLPRKAGRPFAHERQGRRWRKPDPGFVYIAQDAIGRIKIGRTVNPEKRIKVLRVHIGMDVSVISAEPVRNAGSVERELHGLFREKRLEFGEWFLLDDAELQIAVDRLKSLAEK